VLLEKAAISGPYQMLWGSNRTKSKIFTRDGTPVYPHWWGDGTEGRNWQPEIQAACDSTVPNRPGYISQKVMLPRGDYRVASGITLNGPVSLHGENPFDTNIRLNSNALSGSRFVVEMSGEGDELQNLGIDAGGGDVGVTAIKNTSEQANLYRVRIRNFARHGFLIPGNHSSSVRVVDLYVLNPVGLDAVGIQVGPQASLVSIEQTTIISAPPHDFYNTGLICQGTGVRLESVNIENAHTSYSVGVGNVHAGFSAVCCTAKDFTRTAFRMSGPNLRYSLTGCRGRQIPVLPAPLSKGLLEDLNAPALNQDFPARQETAGVNVTR
jgi:hypothetical protein